MDYGATITLTTVHLLSLRLQHPANQRAQHRVLVLNHPRVGFERAGRFDHRHHLPHRVRARHFQVALPHVAFGERAAASRCPVGCEQVVADLHQLVERLGLRHAEGVDRARLRDESVLRNRPRHARDERDFAALLVEHGPLAVLRDEPALRIEREIAGPRQILLAVVAADVKEAIAGDRQVEVVARALELARREVGLRRR